MRLITFYDSRNTAPRLGVLERDTVLDVAASGCPATMPALIQGGATALAALQRTTAEAPRLELPQVTLRAPIPRPSKNIFSIGKNHHEHAREFHASGFDASALQGGAIPDVFIVFSKSPTTVIGPGVAIPAHLDSTQSVDYENQLAVVIGRQGRSVSRTVAYDYVFGYTIVNDVTARTSQHPHKQWFLGKKIDGFCPMGPCIVTADAIADVGAMHLLAHVNSELRQDAYVRDLIFDIPTLIEPGDILATGTPAGVGIGFNPPKYSRRGDVVTRRIDPIGELSNPVE